MKLVFTVLVILTASFGAIGQTVCSSNYTMTCDEAARTEADIKNMKRLLSEAECRLAVINRRKEELFACIANEQNKVNLDRASTLIRSALLEVEALKNAPTKILKPCLTGDCN